VATYQIVARTMDSEDARDWTSDGVGDENSFASVEEARAAVLSLRALGGDWAEAEYGVRDQDGRLVDEAL